MRKRMEVAREVRDALFAREADLDVSIAQAEAFVTMLEGAREELGLNGTLGLGAVAGAREHAARLRAEREELHQVHHAIDAVGKSIGIRPVGIANWKTREGSLNREVA